MYLASLQLEEFRNYASLDLSLPSQGALFVGPNASGKTNLLEAVHLLCLGRSQRRARRIDLVRHEADTTCVRGRFEPQDPGEGAAVDASVGVGRDRSFVLRRNGEAVRSLREWFGLLGVVSFGPDDVNLIQGEPAARRRFLDMLISQMDPVYLEQLGNYSRTLMGRNRTLSTTRDAHLLDALDAQLVDSGEYIYTMRKSVVDFCKPLFSEIHAGISGCAEQGTLAYAPSVPLPVRGGQTWREVFYNALKNNRKRDLDLGYSTCGIHRDSIRFFIDGRPSSVCASRGQCRTQALALRLCSIRCLEAFCSRPLLFLVDDAFSELDETRMAQVYPLIRSRGQVLMTSPADSAALRFDGPVYRVVHGDVRCA